MSTVIAQQGDVIVGWTEGFPPGENDRLMLLTPCCRQRASTSGELTEVTLYCDGCGAIVDQAYGWYSFRANEDGPAELLMLIGGDVQRARAFVRLAWGAALSAANGHTFSPVRFQVDPFGSDFCACGYCGCLDTENHDARGLCPGCTNHAAYIRGTEISL